MITVLIAEDNALKSVEIFNAIVSPNVNGLKIMSDGTKVYDFVKTQKPDVLVLDLKMPGMNGLQVLDLVENDPEIKTKIIVYSGDMGYITLARQYKCVERFYSKLTPAEEIGLEIERIASETNEKELDNQIFKFLLKLGFACTLKGTKKMADCISYSIRNNEDNINNVYTAIAAKNNENVHTFKSDIHTAIKNMWRYTDREKTKKILRLSDCDKPSSKGVISMVKYYIES